GLRAGHDRERRAGPRVGEPERARPRGRERGARQRGRDADRDDAHRDAARARRDAGLPLALRHGLPARGERHRHDRLADARAELLGRGGRRQPERRGTGERAPPREPPERHAQRDDQRGRLDVEHGDDHDPVMPDPRRVYYDHEPAYRKIAAKGGRGWDDLTPDVDQNSYRSLD